MDRIARAAQLARELARSAAPEGMPVVAAASEVRFRAHLAMGDPQAPLETVLAVLDGHGLLGDDGRLCEDVALYSMGDHFDWGGAEDVARAGADGLALLAWLAGHSTEQAHLVLGNHDLARVGELAGFDDATFRRAQALAVHAYATGDDAAERELLARYPALPTAEVAARDFASFTVAQRELVARLLRARRFRIAFAFGRDVLLTHAGVTTRDLVIGEGDDARAIAAALNDRLDAAISDWTGARAALAIAGLYEPGSAARGEAGGIFYYRPTSAPITAASAGRRFDPRDLPRGITQVIGHIGDEKSRALMPAWAVGEPALGALRTLVTDGARVTYGPFFRSGSAYADNRDAEARIVFTDGTMRHAATGTYQVLDLETMAPFVPRPLRD